jgi:hypothetical protein
MTRAQTILLSLALASCLVATGCKKLLTGDGTSAAKTRVRFILQTIRDHGSDTSTELQTAICRWEKDKVVISDRDELGLAADAFDAWRQKGGIYPTLATFEIADKVEEKTAKDPDDTYYVQAKIDGAWHWIRVPVNARISWADPA